MGDKLLGRIHEDLGRPMINKKVMDVFYENNIKGISYDPLEDNINGRFTDNYMPDGVTLKY